MDSPIQIIEDLVEKRKKKKQKIDEQNMNRGCWEPWLPKDYSWMPSNWVGDFDFVFHDRVRKDEKDAYWRVYRTIIVKPEQVYLNLKKMIENNLHYMKRIHIPIVADGPLKVKVHNKITIEICHGDVIKDKSDIKCATINWNVDANQGIAYSFSRFGGPKVQD